jgi:ABC-type phosphate/phosphonate transport system substrate-binding protein
MQLLMKTVFYLLLLICQLMVCAHAEPYRLVAGGSVLGFRENDKQNVTLGFSAAFNELLTASNIKCDFKSFDTTEELIDAVQQNQVNAFFGSPIEYLKVEQYLMPHPVVSGIFYGKLKSSILLVVRADSGIQTLQQLKGKRISSQKWISGDVGGVYLETLLLESKLSHLQKFFNEISFSETSNQALVDLFFKKTDVTLISQNQFDIAAELNPQLRSQTKILVSSEPFLIFVAALRKGTPEPQIENIKNSLLAVNKTAKGKNMLSLIKIQGFKEISSAELENVRELYARNQALRAKQNVH